MQPRKLSLVYKYRRSGRNVNSVCASTGSRVFGSGMPGGAGKLHGEVGLGLESPFVV